MQNLEQIQTGQLGRYCIPLGHVDSGKQINRDFRRFKKINRIYFSFSFSPFVIPTYFSPFCFSQVLTLTSFLLLELVQLKPTK